MVLRVNAPAPLRPVWRTSSRHGIESECGSAPRRTGAAPAVIIARPPLLVRNDRGSNSVKGLLIIHYRAAKIKVPGESQVGSLTQIGRACSNTDLGEPCALLVSCPRAPVPEGQPVPPLIILTGSVADRRQCR